MSNEELKYKIVKTIRGVALWETPSDWFGINERVAEKLADALIERGLAFDENTAVLAERTDAKTLMCKAQRYDEMKRRVEVAERALRNALNNDTCYFCNEKIHCRCEHRDWGSDECIKSLLQQAEKELAEEKSEKRP